MTPTEVWSGIACFAIGIVLLNAEDRDWSRWVPLIKLVGIVMMLPLMVRLWLQTVTG